jgi:DNA-binding NtrC family response regulator
MEHILLISKDYKFCSAAAKYLNIQGVIIEIFRDPKELPNWKYLETKTTIICDYTIDRIDGYTFLVALRDRGIRSKLILVADSFDILNDKPFYYQALTGFFTKDKFFKMIHRLIALKTNNAIT